jgi:hypothetical protein
MARGVWCGFTEQFSAHGSFPLRELHLSAAHLAQDFRCVLADRAGGLLAALLPRLSIDCLGLDGRFPGWVAVTPNSLGECCFVCGPLSLLFVQVQRRIAVEILPVSVLVAWNLGSTQRFTSRSDQSAYCVRSGYHCNRVDDLGMEQQSPLDSQLGAGLAGVVSRDNSTETDPTVTKGNKWRVNLP